MFKKSASTTLIVLSILCGAEITRAEIRELRSYSNFAEPLDESTWVVFDIDNTLLQPTTMIGSDQWFYAMADLDKLRQRTVGSSSQSHSDHSATNTSTNVSARFASEAFAHVQPLIKVERVESSVENIFENATKAGTLTFALTARGSQLTDLTLKQLRSLKYDFETSAPNSVVPVPKMKGRVLFADGTNKGELLLKLARLAKVPPRRIIFIDDKKYNVEAVDRALEGTEFVNLNFRYGGADARVESLNMSIASVQWKTFQDCRRIPSDEEVLNSLTKIKAPNLCKQAGPRTRQRPAQTSTN